MQVGVLYEIQVPRPWHERSQYDAFLQAIEQIRFVTLTVTTETEVRFSTETRSSRDVALGSTYSKTNRG